MNTAVIINLDYEHQHGGTCRSLWDILRTRMERAGFTKSGRRFITHHSVEMASLLATKVMNDVEAVYRADGKALRPYIRDFYCMPDVEVVDLWSPSVNSIEVHQMEAGAFERFFGTPAVSTFAH